MPLRPTASSPPHLLVADDDPISLRYLEDGLRTLGAQVTACIGGAQALHQARIEAYDLLLLDRCMPDAGAREVLTTLRRDRTARSANAPAAVSSAEWDRDSRSELLAAGFCLVLHKPCGITELRGLLELLPAAVSTLDDPAALHASGDAATMQALRTLLRGELASLHQTLRHPEPDYAALGERLHRLRASCGFCGATSLAAETELLQRHLRTQPPETATAAMARFRCAVQATLHALGG